MKSVLTLLLFSSLALYGQPYTPITDPKIKNELDSATYYFKLKQTEKAFSFYDKATLIDSTNLTVLQLKSSGHAYFQQFDDALKTILKQIKLRPNVSYFYLDAGLFHRRLGNREESIHYLKEAVKLFDIEIRDSANNNSDSSHPYFLRAIALLFSDQESKGRAVLKDIYEKNKETMYCTLWGHLDDHTDQLIIRWLDTDMSTESKK